MTTTANLTNAAKAVIALHLAAVANPTDLAAAVAEDAALTVFRALTGAVDNEQALSIALDYDLAPDTVTAYVPAF